MKPLGHSVIFYRPDIDGLRALAIIAVVGFHAFPNIFPGGFIGVDVFFTISGFLITSIIFKQSQTNTFSFKSFYSRRIKRLFPALILVLGCGLIYGYFVMLPGEFKSLGKYTVSSVLFATNFTLYGDAGYFDVVSEQKPLLHLWSLSIEEQFYLVWPILIYLLSKKSRAFTFLMTGGLALFSFSLNIYFSFKNPSLAFYLPFTRFWEFLVGALASYIYSYSKISIPLPLYTPLSLLGFLLINFSIIFFNKLLIFPGWWALCPTLGAFILLLCKDSALNSKIFSHKILVFIGLISYPLYLWHWPIFSFLHIIYPYADFSFKIIAIFVSLLLSVLTYRYIEVPLRALGFKCLFCLVSLMSIVGIIGYLMSINKFPPWVESLPDFIQIDQAGKDYTSPEQLNWKPLKLGSHVCFQKGNNKKKVLFFGDSQMEQFVSRIDKKLKENPHSKAAIFATQPGCVPINNVHTFPIPLPNCSHFSEEVMALSAHPDIDTIVISALWVHYLDTNLYYYKGQPIRSGTAAFKMVLAEFMQMIENMKKNGKEVYIILNIPFGEHYGPKNFIKRDIVGGWKIAKFFPCLKEWRLHSQKVSEELKKVAQATNTFILDPANFLCDSKRCFNCQSDKTPIYLDNTHLRASYVKAQVIFLDEIMQDKDN